MVQEIALRVQGFGVWASRLALQEVDEKQEWVERRVDLIFHVFKS